MSALPIETVRGEFVARHRAGAVVVSSPTGSGKSTMVPRWCAGPVLVVEPRRVACRSLAVRVAELEGCALGTAVGYRVRDDDRSRRDTRILFATPGVVLRMLAAGDVAAYGTVVVDEFHERSLDVDLLLALLVRDRPARLVVMSATLDGDRVAEHVSGVHVAAEGRTFPVDRRHLPGDALLPDVRGLERRVNAAIDAAADDPGDLLVFLPGKAEIASVAQAVRGRDLEVVTLHGGLSLDEQSRAFAPARRRKVVLATNVAETSVTIPGIGVVVDSGLVRRTRYHGGRGFLTLLPVALDSAEQRAGRAGRTAAGVCYRLWDAAANLQPSTPPEVHRESLVPLVLGAAACGARTEGLPFLDAPKPHALAAATDELTALGAVADGTLTATGRQLFGLPLDAPLGRLLVEARRTGAIEDAVDLVAVLAVGRPLFAGGSDEDLRDAGCDAVAFIRAVRVGQPRDHGLRSFTLQEARRVSARLRRAFSLPARTADAPIDRRRLALTALAADFRCAHVARRRKRKVAWSNGGTEIELGRDSAVQRDLDDTEAILVFETRALGVGRSDTRIVATCAMPVPLPWLLAAGVGRQRIDGVVVRGGRVLARASRVYARKVLSTEELVPEGELARDAVARAFLEGRFFAESLAQTTERLEATALQARLDGEAPPLELEAWVHARVTELGVESGDDLALLSPGDLLAPDLPAWQREQLDRSFPRMLELRDASYAVRYDLKRKKVTLEQVAGRRRDPPPRTWLPAFRGFRVEHKSGNVLHKY